MTVTLEDARARLRAGFETGTTCLCCGQFAKLYRRKLNSTMARGLCWLARAAGRPPLWVDVSASGPRWLVSKGGTLATLSHWGLIAAKSNSDEAKRCSGIWRPTDSGFQFLDGRIRVPKYVLLFDNIRRGFSDESTDIREALGDKFDYSELWTPAPETATQQQELFR